jgi:DnaJ-class molecular chaperone
MKPSKQQDSIPLLPLSTDPICEACRGLGFSLVQQAGQAGGTPGWEPGTVFLTCAQCNGTGRP